MKPFIAAVPSYPVSIFIAGAAVDAVTTCQSYCDAVGLCVTVTETLYVFTDGFATGVIVGLINYPRFPATPEEIWTKAEVLARKLREGMEQESFTIQAPDKTVWFSWRAEDCDSDGTATAALCEDIAVPKDCQARAESIAQNTPDGGSNVSRY